MGFKVLRRGAEAKRIISPTPTRTRWSCIWKGNLSQSTDTRADGAVIVKFVHLTRTVGGRLYHSRVWLLVIGYQPY